MARVMEENGLSTRTEESFELAPTAAAAEKQFEIQSAIVIAKKFPRNEDQCFAKLMKSCQRSTFAEDAAYSFPRGKVQDDKGNWVQNYVEGPSVNVAREAARIWGNFRYGVDVIRDDDESRQIRGWAWDMETNTKVTAEDDFKKLIYRKQGGWVTPDEREMRELTNRRGAILVRNSILQLLPKDLIEDAIKRCDETLKKGATEDPDGAKKRVILSFSELNITPTMLEAKLGHPLAECSPAEVAELRKIYRSISDGNSTWRDYMEESGTQEKEKTKTANRGTLDINDLKPGKEENRGHGKENLAAAARPHATSEPTVELAGVKPEADKGECSMMDFSDIETAAKAAKLPMKSVQEHVTKTMGFDTYGRLTKARMPEVLKWISSKSLTPPKPEPEAAAPPSSTDELVCTEAQFGALDSAKLNHDVEPKTLLQFVKGTLGYAMYSRLKQKDFDRVMKFLEAGGKEAPGAQ